MKKMLKRGIAGILSAVMGVTTLTVVAYADNEVTTPVTAKISGYVSTSGTYDAAFMLMCDELEVASNEAESFGFSDTVTDGVSIMDAIVKLHEERYGEDFNLDTASEYIKINDGYFSKMFKKVTFDIGYAHNKQMAGTPYTKITDGDRLEIFFYANPKKYWYTDAYVPHDDIKVIKGEEVTLNAPGYMFMLEDPTFEDIQLAYIEDNVPVLVDEEAFTDQDGNITVTFNEAGTYTLSFTGETMEGSPVILSPFKVEVIDFEAYDKTAAQLETEFAFGKEWNILGLARGGYEISDADKEQYYNSVIQAYNAGEMDDANAYSKVVIALSALGLEVPEEFIKELSSYENVYSKYAGPAIFALIAMDSGNFDFETMDDSDDQNTRQRLIDHIIDLKNEGRAFAYTDIYSMAIQALAKYRNDPKVENMINDCIDFIEKTNITGVEANAQVIVAYNALGIDASKYFKKMMSYYDANDGFTSQGVPTITRQQALYALASYKRAIHNDTALYDMSDTVDTVSLKAHNDGGYSISAPKDNTVTAISVKYNEDSTLDKVYFNNAFDLKKGSLNYFKPEFEGGKVMLWDSNLAPVVFNIK